MSSLQDLTSLKNAMKEQEYEILKYLTSTQISEIADCFMIPLKGIDMVLESYNKQNRFLVSILFENILIYPGIFKEFKNKLKNMYLASLIEAGTGIGAITSDAIGQQATQALLNTMHSVGSAKSGGPDGIKENITLSANRKILYSILHMKNARMTFAEMMELKRKFIGVTVADLLLKSEQPGESLVVDIGKEHERNPFDMNKSDEEKFKIFNSNHSWWYCLYNFNNVHDFTNNLPRERTCLRLKFNLQKLYDYRITTTEIASIINKNKFQFTTSKRLSKSNSKRSIEEQFVYAVPSPTHIGIVDIFTMNLSDTDDYLLISLIHGKKFSNLVIGGIAGINNFYAVSTGITRLMRDVTKTSRFDEEFGKKGMWLYLENNRFLGIPYSRILSALDTAGIKYEMPHYNSPDSYNLLYTDIPFEYHAHKSVPELRTSMKIRAYLFSNMVNHEFPTYKFTQFTNGVPTIVDMKPQIDHYKYEPISQGFDVAFYPYTSYTSYDGLICNKKFESRDDFLPFISKLNYCIDSENFRKLFTTTDPIFNTFFTSSSTEYKLVAFEIGYKTEPTPEHPEGLDSVYYLVYYLFQIKYIDYQINTNLDYCNSRYVTQSLDSVLDTQFYIPFNNLTGQLPEVLRKYKILETVTIKKPERRIFIKTHMFLKNTYDFQGIFNRKVIIKYLNTVNSEDTDDNKEKLVLKIAKDLNEKIHGFDDIIEYCVNIDILPQDINDSQNMIDILYEMVKKYKAISIDMKTDVEKEIIKQWDTSISKITSAQKLKPFDRFISFLNRQLSENDLNYVYAETSGCNFSKSLTNPLIAGHRTICNHFIQVYDVCGLEGMKNCQNNDLIGMINSSGYISVEYMNFLTNVTTFNGRNPMTSNGVSGQDNRDWLAMATFDSAAGFVKQAALIGKEQNADSTSTCIVLGKKFKTGTGYINVVIDKTKLTISNKQSGISEEFIKLSGIAKPVGDLFMDDSDGPIYIPKLEVSKFPPVKWIYENFITRDIVFYIQQGIDKTCKDRLDFFETIDCSEIDVLDNMLFKIEPNPLPRAY